MISKNFKQEEFKCKCGCGEMRISPTVVLLCQMVRDKFKKPVRITSGCRCKKHNSKVGGAALSQHVPKGDELCHAADIQVDDVEPRYVYGYLNELFPSSLGLGIYNTWVHIDDRLDRPYRWDSRKH